MTDTLLDFIPTRYHVELQRADLLFKLARAAAIAGDHAEADRLRDKAEEIYSRVDAALPEGEAE